MSTTMTTTIRVNHRELRIDTSGFGWNTLHRHHELHAELWQWHEAVADAISNHHASVMGAMFPCPEPTVEEIREALDARPILLPPPGPPPSPKCMCIDCGGTENSHSPTCEMMNDLYGDEGPAAPGEPRVVPCNGIYPPGVAEGTPMRVTAPLPEGFSPVSHM